MTHAIYNEIEPFACDWLDSLIGERHVAFGHVNRRPIERLVAEDVSGPGQRHFFAGIGGWSHALRLAGVPDDADIWTGSCPCQPFSDAGTRSGTRDARHLWPAWFELIRECRPPTIFGEQVASRDGLAWLDLVRADLERCGYAFGASDLCAASVGSPHRRQRLYFVAHTREGGCSKLGASWLHERGQRGDHVARRGPPGDLVDTKEERCGSGRRDRAHGRSSVEPERPVLSSGLGDTSGDGARQLVGELPRDESQHEVRRTHRDHPSFAPGATGGFWERPDWLYCQDGKWRPVEPRTFPLAHGVPGRVGLLRGYGNGIVPEVAASFIRAARAAIQEQGR